MYSRHLAILRKLAHDAHASSRPSALSDTAAGAASWAQWIPG
jgi:hypothetical protein